MHGGRVIPFTPFHFGPGLLIKACVLRSFWLTSFIFANVLIDVEVLFYILSNDPPLHRHLHTYIGGTTVGIFSGLVMFGAVCLLQRFRPGFSYITHHVAALPKARLLIQSLIAGLIGGVSHIFLDSLMHRDMHPWWPFSNQNQLIGVVGVGSLHGGCALAGFFGLVLLLLLRHTRDNSR